MIRITAWLAMSWVSVAALQAAVADTPTTHNGITVDAQGQLVHIDEARRAQLVAHLRAAMAAAGTPAKSGPAKALSDGTQALRMGAEHTAFVVAYTNDDDTLEVQCVMGVDAAAQVLAVGETK